MGTAPFREAAEGRGGINNGLNEQKAGEERPSKEGLAENEGLRARPQGVAAVQEGGPHGEEALLHISFQLKTAQGLKGWGGQLRGKALRDPGLGREKTKPEPIRNPILGTGLSLSHIHSSWHLCCLPV